jgi:hypothetical protein
MKRTGFNVVASVVFAALFLVPSTALAQVAPSLGTASSFAILGGSTVTNTGSSVVTGNLGVSPGAAVTGFPPGTVVSGTTHSANAVSLQAQSDVTTAYNNLAGQVCTTDLTGQDLGGMVLTHGVYCFSNSAALTGTLTLNAEGDANAVFIFQIGTTLTTAGASSVVMSNSGSACNVYWQVGSSATLGTTTAFGGSILALTSITLTTGANMTGRALARNGAVTLDTNNVTVTPCAPAGCFALTVSPGTLPNGTQGTAYSQTLTGSGGTGPYSFAVTTGSLPAGLTLTSGGVLSGTPTTAGVSSFTVGTLDAIACVGEEAYSFTTDSPVPTLPQWGALLLGVGLLGLGYRRLRRGPAGTARTS